MFFWNKKKKYVSCDLIEHGLDFAYESITFCCRIPPTGKGYKKIIENFSGEKINWRQFFNIKRKYRNQMKKGNIVPECKGCIYLQEKEWDNEDYISYINFNNWITCNEHCIYCDLNDDTGFVFPPQFNIFPVIKDMVDKGHLRKGGDITIAGGEPCFAPEFNDLIDLFLKLDLSPIRVLTNATIYSEALERGIKSGNINIDVSVDSGTREMFKKIKRRDFYDKVWENIRRYASVQMSPSFVKTKYILIPEVNDIKSEIDAWIQKSIESCVGKLVLDIEMMYFHKHDGNLPENTVEAFKYAVEQIRSKNIELVFIDRGLILANKLNLNNN